MQQNGYISKPGFSTRGSDADFIGVVSIKVVSTGKEYEFTATKREQTKQKAYDSVANIALKKIGKLKEYHINNDLILGHILYRACY